MSKNLCEQFSQRTSNNNNNSNIIILYSNAMYTLQAML